MSRKAKSLLAGTVVFVTLVALSLVYRLPNEKPDAPTRNPSGIVGPASNSPTRRPTDSNLRPSTPPEQTPAASTAASSTPYLDALFTPGPILETYRELEPRARQGDGEAAWRLHQAIDLCYTTPETDEELSKELDTMAQTHTVKSRLGGRRYIDVGGLAQPISSYVDTLEQRFSRCNGIPRNAELAYFWLVQSAASGYADAEIEFFTRGIPYVEERDDAWLEHSNLSKSFLRSAVARGDRRAYVSLFVILSREPSTDQDHVEMAALAYAATAIEPGVAAYRDWWKRSRERLSPHEEERARALGETYLADCCNRQP